MDRRKQIVSGYNAAGLTNQTSANYDDVARTRDTYTDLDTNGNKIRLQVVYDSHGRQVESRQYTDATNYISTMQSYDGMARVKSVSNPGNAGANTTSAYDGLGRVTSVTTPDLAAVTRTYSGNSTTTADSASPPGKRAIVTDALGRVTNVTEDPSPGLNYQTSYTYDALDNLTGVTQPGQTRTFIYDSLKRLKNATNPETGTAAVTYSYDAACNM